MASVQFRVMACTAIAFAIAGASTANAAVYDYATSLSVSQDNVAYDVGPQMASTVSINTATGTGTIIGSGANGSAINVSFTGDFSNFTGGPAPLAMPNVSIASNSSITFNGSTYSVLSPTAGHPDMLMLGQNMAGTAIADYTNLWAEWTSPSCAGGNCIELGDTTGLYSSTSGGSGGTAVPEPGMVGILGLGLAMLVMRRRYALAEAATA